jgi:putative ABC transport system permease protein
MESELKAAGNRWTATRVELYARRYYVDSAYGLHLPIAPPKAETWATLGAIVLGGCAAGLLPALRAYRLSLADGMTVRT